MRRLREMPGRYQTRQPAPPGLIIPCLLAFLTAVSAYARASENIVVPADTNSWIVVENAIVKGNGTTVFFLTRPDIRDPEARNPCALNYYSTRLQPGLPSASPAVVARGVCGGTAQKSRLLDNGDALIIVRDRLERWRAGEKISSRKFSSIDSVSKLGISTDMAGSQFYDIAADGSLLLVVQSGHAAGGSNEHAGSTIVMTALKPDGKQRWKARFSQQDAASMVKQAWIGANGSALLHANHLESGLSPAEEARLHFVSASGAKKLIVLNESGTAPDFANMSNMTPQDLQRYFQEQQQAEAESIGNLDAVARDDGGFDILFQRKGGGEGREGFFLYRLDADGNVQSELALGSHIERHGLERWSDFRIEGNQLILLSQAPVTQKVVRKVRKKWGQNIVSWIDMDTGIPVPRLIPLDQRYLEAAMSAGDEGQQYLEGQPGSEPVLLSKLGGKPLVVSVGWVSKRQVIRLHEADETLTVFTEVMDERQAKADREAGRRQRAADRDATTARMRVAEAAAAGMSEEEYSALSPRQQKEAIIRNAGHEQLMQTMMQEAQTQQERQAAAGTNTSRQQATDNPFAAAMAQAQQQMASDPNIPPEMRAQMAAAMAGMNQGAGNQSATMPGMPFPSPPQQDTGRQAPLPDDVLKVDAGRRGFIEYENPDGRLMTLLIFDRQSGEELLEKDYRDGVIYEYVDFNRFNRPLEQIGVIYREVSGLILKDLTPVVSQ